MKTKTLLVSSLVLNAGLLASVAFLANQGTVYPAAESVRAQGPDRVIVAPAQEGAQLRFGPVYEAVLLSARDGERVELFDLEKGRRLLEPDFEAFNRSAPACSAWLRSMGLDIGSLNQGNNPAGCVCYYMAVVPCRSNDWDSVTAADVVNSTDLKSIEEPKRKSLVAQEQASFYLFRTLEGNRGVLRIPPASEAKEGLRIRYRLVNTPSETPELASVHKGS